MSKSALQFIELVRQAYHNPRNENQNQRRYYCQVCGSDTQHNVTPNGQYETFTCCQCGSSTSVRTR